jgi:hypothetical protein
MTPPRDHLPRDLKALRYLDALNAGDLEAVAALWEQASRDPELERILAELEGALFVENSTGTGNAGAERGVELSPKQWPSTRRRWAVWVGVVGTLAAACLLAVLAWSRRGDKPPQPGPATNNSASQVTPRAPNDLAAVPGWPEGRRVVDGPDVTTFHWPLPETPPDTLSTSIPADLLY